ANAFSFFFFALFFASSAIFARVSLSLPPTRSPPLLHSLHQPLPTTALSRRQGIALAFERILVGAEFDAYRRAFESEGLAEDVAEIAAIGVGDVLHLVAVHDDDRRVAAALVCVAQLDAPAAYERRLMLLDCGFEHARELGCRHLAHRCIVGMRDAAHQLADARAVQRGDEMNRRELEKRQA